MQPIYITLAFLCTIYSISSAPLKMPDREEDDCGVDYCEMFGSICKNNGRCISNGCKSGRCVCPVGVTGHLCETLLVTPKPKQNTKKTKKKKFQRNSLIMRLFRSLAFPQPSSEERYERKPSLATTTPKPTTTTTVKPTTTTTVMTTTTTTATPEPIAEILMAMTSTKKSELTMINDDVHTSTPEYQDVTEKLTKPERTLLSPEQTTIMSELPDDIQTLVTENKFNESTSSLSINVPVPEISQNTRSSNGISRFDSNIRNVNNVVTKTTTMSTMSDKDIEELTSNLESSQASTPMPLDVNMLNIYEGEDDTTVKDRPSPKPSKTDIKPETNPRTKDKNDIQSLSYSKNRSQQEGHTMETGVNRLNNDSKHSVNDLKVKDSSGSSLQTGVVRLDTLNKNKYAKSLYNDVIVSSDALPSLVSKVDDNAATKQAVTLLAKKVEPKPGLVKTEAIDGNHEKVNEISTIFKDDISVTTKSTTTSRQHTTTTIPIVEMTSSEKSEVVTNSEEPDQTSNDLQSFTQKFLKSILKSFGVPRDEQEKVSTSTTVTTGPLSVTSHIITTRHTVEDITIAPTEIMNENVSDVKQSHLKLENMTEIRSSKSNATTAGLMTTKSIQATEKDILTSFVSTTTTVKPTMMTSTNTIPLSTTVSSASIHAPNRKSDLDSSSELRLKTNKKDTPTTKAPRVHVIDPSHLGLPGHEPVNDRMSVSVHLTNVKASESQGQKNVENIINTNENNNLYLNSKLSKNNTPAAPTVQMTTSVTSSRVTTAQPFTSSPQVHSTSPSGHSNDVVLTLTSDLPKMNIDATLHKGSLSSSDAHGEVALIADTSPRQTFISQTTFIPLTLSVTEAISNVNHT